MRVLPVKRLSPDSGKVPMRIPLQRGAKVLRMQLLLVEDDPTMQATLHRALSRRGMHVAAVGDGRTALSQWVSRQPDAVVLDLTLPGLDGLEVLQQARAQGLRTPVLILTARGTVGDRVVGLNAGADDYLPKPFDLDELEARLRALVRRSADPANAPAAGGSVQIGAIRYDRHSGALYLRGDVMELTPRELALMHALLAQPGHAVTKERLYELVFPGQLDVQYEAIEVVVYRLRKKLAGTGLTLMTLRGLGYLLKPDTA
jgi:two-component system response regulator TctD